MKSKDLFAFISFIIAININPGHGSRTRDSMYREINGVGCFRRMNGTHQFGCSSGRWGSTGVIYFVEDAQDIKDMLELGTAQSYIPVMSLEKLTWANVDLLKGSDKVSGLIVYKLNETILEEYSQEDTCPNRNYGVEGTCDVSWNHAGTNLLNYDFGYPVFFLTNNTEFEEVQTCFTNFNNVSLESHYRHSLCSLELTFFMYAVIDTPTCLRRSIPRLSFNPPRFCDPIGSYNIWSSLFPIGNATIQFGNATQKMTVRDDIKHIILASRLDATSLFFGKVPGAINPVSNVVTLLYTAHLLKQMLPNYKDYDKNVLFVFFNGESYDYMGSQRFLYDMEEKRFPDITDLNKNETAKNIFPSNVTLFIELSQMSQSQAIHTHMLQENEQLRNFMTIFKKYSEQIKVFEHQGRIPPSSLQTFLKNYPKTSGVVLSDHGDRNYTNKFYNSMLDDAENLKYEYMNSSRDVPKDSIQQYIVDVSRILARSLYEEITQQEAPKELVNVQNLTLVDELLYCYLININCSIHHVIQKKHYEEGPVSLYVGVPKAVNIVAPFTGLTLAWLTSDIVNSTGPCPGDIDSKLFTYYNMSRSLTNSTMICYRSCMNFTDSTSPAFLIDDYDWTSGKYSSWSESSWQQPNIRMFLRPTRAHENMTMAVGSVTMILSFVLAYLIKSRSHILFPQPIEAASPTRC